MTLIGTRTEPLSVRNQELCLTRMYETSDAGNIIRASNQTRQRLPGDMAPSIEFQEEPFDLKFGGSEKPRRSWKSLNFPGGEDWPEFLQSPLVWEPNDFKNEENFVYTLDEDDVTEIIDALDGFKGTECLPFLSSSC